MASTCYRRPQTPYISTPDIHIPRAACLWPLCPCAVTQKGRRRYCMDAGRVSPASLIAPRRERGLEPGEKRTPQRHRRERERLQRLQRLRHEQKCCLSRPLQALCPLLCSLLCSLSLSLFVLFSNSLSISLSFSLTLSLSLLSLSLSLSLIPTYSSWYYMTVVTETTEAGDSCLVSKHGRQACVAVFRLRA